MKPLDTPTGEGVPVTGPDGATAAVGGDATRGKPARVDPFSGAITPMQQMISACSGALVTSLIVTPLDVVKIRLQAQQRPFKTGSCFIYSNGLLDCLCVCSHCANGNNGAAGATSGNQPRSWYGKRSHFTGTVRECRAAVNGPRSMTVGLGRDLPLRGTVDAFMKIARYEGLGSLWSGLPPTLVMAVPATVVYFTTYDQLKYALGYQEHDPRTKYTPMLAGSLARILAVTLISPLELIRTKMQSQQLTYRELGRAVQFTLQQGGFLSMMRGLGPTLLRDVPFSALYWFGYEYVKAEEMRRFQSSQLTFWQTFAAGGISGSVAAICTCPFDVIKTHRQIALGEAETMKSQQLSSTWKLISRLYAQNGLSALFAGLVPRLVKVAPACAIMISAYEYGKAFFRQHNQKQTSQVAKDWS